MYSCKYVGDHASVCSKELGSVHSPDVQMYNGLFKGSNTTVHCRGGVLSWEGLFSEVPLYLKIHRYAHNALLKKRERLLSGELGKRKQ